MLTMQTCMRINTTNKWCLSYIAEARQQQAGSKNDEYVNKDY